MACDTYTKLMLHCNGTDASTTFTDDSASAKTVTAVGNAQLDTAQKKFGLSSGLFDGTGDYLTVPDHADFDFTAGFTIDMWVRFSSVGAYSGFVTSSAGINDWNDIFFHHVDNKIEWQIEGNNHRWAWDPLVDTWYHLAFIRDDSNNLKIYVDGATLTLTNGTGTHSGTVALGGTLWLAASSTLQMTGWIDELRISNTTRWTTTFTPPVVPHCLVPMLLTFFEDFLPA